MWLGYVTLAYELMGELRPSLVLDIGSSGPDLYFGCCQAITDGRFGCAAYFGISSHAASVVVEEAREHNDALYPAFSKVTAQLAPESFSDGSVHLLHVDLRGTRRADETLNGWLPKVAASGVVLLSGIDEREQQADGWKVWERVRDSGEHFAFHHGGGLGIWRKPGAHGDGQKLLLGMFDGSPPEQDDLRRRYEVYAEYLEGVLYRKATSRLDDQVAELTAELHATRHERIFLETELTRSQQVRDDAVRETKRLVGVLEGERTRSAPLDAEIQRLHDLIHSERQVMQALMNSLSWRVTAPLRKVTGLLRGTNKG